MIPLFFEELPICAWSKDESGGTRVLLRAPLSSSQGLWWAVMEREAQAESVSTCKSRGKGTEGKTEGKPPQGALEVAVLYSESLGSVRS